MADPMRIRAQAAGDKTTVRVLMSHEMETGQRKDADGKTIPAWFIQEVSASLNGKPVLAAEWGPAVSKNPFLQFVVKGAKAGDTYTVTFTRKNPGEGKTIPFGLAIHGDHATGRFHHVSLGYTLGIGAAGDVKAVKQ